MSSIQSTVANLVVRTFQRGFFTSKAEIKAHRRSFERVSRLIRFPGRVREEHTDLEGMDAWWFYPKQRTAEKVLLFLHGGAYCTGSVQTHRAMIARIARAAACPALGINYRLAPEHPHPAALDDALTAYRHLLDTGNQKVYLIGDSAGGGLAMALMLRIRDLGLPLPAGAVLLSPWTDLAMKGESIETKAHVEPLLHAEILARFAGFYIGDGEASDPLISPLYGELHSLPPVLIQVGGREILLDDATRLAKRLKKAGVDVELQIWDEMFHVWQFMGGYIPEAGEAIRVIGRFVQHTPVVDGEIIPQEAPGESSAVSRKT